MSDELKVVDFDDLDKLDKGVSVVKLFIDGVCVGEGTLHQIAEQLGRTQNSIQVGLSRSRKEGNGKYRVELVKHVVYRRKQYIAYKRVVGTDYKYEIARGTMKEIAEQTGYSEIHLRITENDKTRVQVENRRRTERRGEYELVVEEWNGR